MTRIEFHRIWGSEDSCKGVGWPHHHHNLIIMISAQAKVLRLANQGIQHSHDKSPHKIKQVLWRCLLIWCSTVATYVSYSKSHRHLWYTSPPYCSAILVLHQTEPLLHFSNIAVLAWELLGHFGNGLPNHLSNSDAAPPLPHSGNCPGPHIILPSKVRIAGWPVLTPLALKLHQILKYSLALPC